MQNITKFNYFQHLLKNNGKGRSSIFPQNFSVCATLAEKNKRKYFLEIPEGLVSEPEQKEESEEDENTIILKKCDKSGLRPFDYKIHHHQCPDFTDDEREIMPLWRYRKLYGRYGNSANIDLKALWPSVHEMELMKERERVEFPHTIQETITQAKEKRLEEEQEIITIQKEIQENLKKLDKWKKNVLDKMAKKEMEAKRILEVKERQIEEVREILGYKISPHDPKFQEILEKKLEEDKKAAKKEKKLRRQQMELEKLMETAKKDAEEEESMQGKVIK